MHDRPGACSVLVIRDTACNACDLPDDQAAAGWSFERVAAILSAGENARVARLRALHQVAAQRTAREYAISHALLRIALGRRLGIPAGQVALASPGEPFVAPALADPAAKVQISLSHAGGFIAIALSTGSAVGIDIEPTSRTDALEAADRFLSPEEMAYLDSLASRDRHTAALEAWCLKEAVLKASGDGLATDPRSFSVLGALADRGSVAAVLLPASGWPDPHPARPDACHLRRSARTGGEQSGARSAALLHIAYADRC